MKHKFTDEVQQQSVQEILLSILFKIEKIENETQPEQKWLSGKEVEKRLSVSSRSLQNYRDSLLLPFSQIGSKIYYKAVDIEKHLEDGYLKP